MGEHVITELEEYCYDRSSVIPDESPEWLFITFLDELQAGRLAYRALEGTIAGLDLILDHRFWVFGLLENVEENTTEAFCRAFHRSEDPPTASESERIESAVMAQRGDAVTRTEAEGAGDVVAMTHTRTIAAMSVGQGQDGRPATVLYWHPFFTADIAIGILQETVRIWRER